MRERYPQARIVFGADNDEATEGNPGVSKAMEAALAIGSVVAVPRRPGDFNDLAAAFGLEAVRLSFTALVRYGRGGQARRAGRSHPGAG